MASDRDGEVLTANRVTISSFALGAELQMQDEDSVIRVGQDVEAALSGAFAKPKKGTVIREMPPGFDDSFDVSGWEIYDRNVAVLSKEGRVVLALDHREKLTDETAESLALQYVLAFGEPMVVVENDRVRYHFWQEGTVMLMVADAQGRTSRSVTVALGLQTPMEKLRMSPEAARTDAEAALALLTEPVPNPDATSDQAGASE